MAQILHPEKNLNAAVVKDRVIYWLSRIMPYVLVRRFLPRKFILYGHVVSNNKHAVGNYYQYPSLTEFAELISELKELGYRFVGLQEYLADSQDKVILLTFDDGFKVIFDELHPFMQKHKLPYAVFVITASLENENFRIPGIEAPAGERLFMNEAEILQLQRDGVHIGFHTKTHIRTHDGLNPEDHRAEFFIPQSMMHLFSKPLVFAYPYMAPLRYGRFDRYIADASSIEYFFDTKGLLPPDGNHLFRASIDGELQLSGNWLRFVIKRQLVFSFIKKIQAGWMSSTIQAKA